MVTNALVACVNLLLFALCKALKKSYILTVNVSRNNISICKEYWVKKVCPDREQNFRYLGELYYVDFAEPVYSESEERKCTEPNCSCKGEGVSVL